MLNDIVIMGRLTKDPELRYTQAQVAVCSFSVAVERDYAPQGQKRETDFFDCVAWRQSGEFVSKYFHKGEMIAVKGRMQMRDWTDDNGNKRRNWELQVDSNYFCGNKSDSQNSGQGGQSAADYYAQHGQYGAASAPPPAAAPAQPQYTQQQFTELDDDDGDLPF